MSALIAIERAGVSGFVGKQACVAENTRQVILGCVIVPSPRLGIVVCSSRRKRKIKFATNWSSSKAGCNVLHGQSGNEMNFNIK
ncbi:hypothetical protein BC938DRAFT_480712 [Jimgerdemannia flammicorona]|uniref:Uncharacterized protein n=1 Tax=Jimgerdemannia flammicorona TaxID=994334 RepID=A0A433QHW2_9FUNG|nr:hypothetical protein BC938DRAFT_480712 [Jimgerdemannia flammicorona]